MKFFVNSRFNYFLWVFFLFIVGIKQAYAAPQIRGVVSPTEVSANAVNQLSFSRDSIAIENNDLLLVTLAIRGGTNVAITNIPSDWTLVQRINDGVRTALITYSRTLTNVASEPTSYTFNFSSNIATGTLIAISNARLVNPVVLQSGVTRNGTVHRSPSRTSPINDGLLLILRAANHGGEPFTVLNPMTSLFSSQTGAGTNGTTLSVASENISVALGNNNITSRNATSSNSVRSAISTLLIAPAINTTAEFRFDELTWGPTIGGVQNTEGILGNGTAHNNAVTTPGVVCRAGKFNGTNQYIEVPGLSSILNGTATLSMWVRTTQTGNNTSWRAPGITGVEQSGGTNDIFWGWLDVSGRIRLNVGNTTGARSNASINDGQWRHIVFTRHSPTGQTQLFINGVLQQRVIAQSGIITTPFTSIGRIENTLAHFSGELDEVKVFDRVLTAQDILTIYNNERRAIAWDARSRTCASESTCVVDPFPGGALTPNLWNTSSVSGTFVPQVVSVNGQNRLRMTDAVANRSTLAQIRRIYPGAGNRISIEFDYYLYGGTGADGLTVTLSDATIPPVPGGFGGSLGYAQRSGIDGFSGGWLGIALDEFGNFPNNTEGRQGYPAGWTPPSGANVAVGHRPNNISIRGSGSGSTGYQLLANTGTLSIPLWSNDANINNSSRVQRFRIIVDHSDNVRAMVSVERDVGANGTYTMVIPPFDVRSAPGQATVPTSWLVSFTGATGGATNIREIANLNICATSVQNQPGSSDAAQFTCLDNTAITTWSASARKPLYTAVSGSNFVFDVAALRNNGDLESNFVAPGDTPRNVLVELFNQNSAITCTSYSAPVASQNITFTSNVFNHQAGRVTTSNWNIATAHPALICRVRECTDASCTSFTTQPPSCSSDAFTVRPPSFTSISSPSSGVSWQQANADNAGSNVNATPRIVAGDNFSLQVNTDRVGYTGTPSWSLNPIEWPIGPGAVGVITGLFPGATASTGNTTGFSFQYSEVGYFRVRPGGLVDNSWVSFSGDSVNGDCIAESSSNNLTSGRVGCLITNTEASPYFGRFIPAYLDAANPLFALNSQQCSFGCGTFQYMDAPLQMEYTLTARNRQGQTTLNYTGAWAKLGLTTSNLVQHNVRGITSSGMAGPIFDPMSRTENIALSGTWNNGVANVQLRLTPQSLRVAGQRTPDGPWDVAWGIAPVDSDNVALNAVSLNLNADGVAGDERHRLGTHNLRFGRLSLTNVLGTNTRGLRVNIEAQYWNNGIWVRNTDDSHTVIPPGSIAFGRYTGTLNETHTNLDLTQSRLMLSNGQGWIKLSPPGSSVRGTFDVGINLSNKVGTNQGRWHGPPMNHGSGDSPTTSANLGFLSSNAGASGYNTDQAARVTFGAFRSNDRIVDIREQY